MKVISGSGSAFEGNEAGNRRGEIGNRKGRIGNRRGGNRKWDLGEKIKDWNNEF